LKWVNLQGSTDVGALERFAQRFSQSKLKEDALRRIESVRAEPLRETTAQPEASDPMQQTLLDQGSTLGSTGDKSPPDLRTPDGKKRARRLAVLVVVAVGVVIALLQRGTPNRRDSQGNVTAENSAPRGDGNAPSTSSPPQIDAKLVTRPEPPRPASFNKYLNYDMKGGDISSSDGNIFRRTDASGCQASCRAKAACLAYSFDKWNSACYLKSTLSVLTLDPHSDTSIRDDRQLPGVTSDARHFCSYNNSSLTGEGSQRFQSQTARDCEQSCEPDQNCIAYTFSRSDRQCSTFLSVSNRQTNATNMVSGVRTQYPCN
jgi:PAN domain